MDIKIISFLVVILTAIFRTSSLLGVQNAEIETIVTALKYNKSLIKTCKLKYDVILSYPSWNLSSEEIEDIVNKNLSLMDKSYPQFLQNQATKMREGLQKKNYPHRYMHENEIYCDGSKISISSTFHEEVDGKPTGENGTLRYINDSEKEIEIYPLVKPTIINIHKKYPLKSNPGHKNPFDYLYDKDLINALETNQTEIVEKTGNTMTLKCLLTDGDYILISIGLTYGMNCTGAKYYSASGVIQEEMGFTNYNLYNEQIWFPKNITISDYEYDGNTESKRLYSYIFNEAQFNIPISAGYFEFKEYSGARVTDMRYNPAIEYMLETP